MQKTTMRAVVYDKYGGPEVLRLEEVDRPVPKDDEVLVKIFATTVNRSDCGWRSGKPFFSRFFSGVRRPKYRTPGGEFAGEVAAVGAAVTKFAVGDYVFGHRGSGANAEFVCARESRVIAHKPEGTTFVEAAAAPDGVIIARACLRRADLRSGRSILIYGASGAIGTAGVQLARHAGAHVTAVCDTKHLELAKSLGADEVIDFTQEDFTKSGKKYDVVFDAVGKSSFRRCRRSIVRGGLYVETDLAVEEQVADMVCGTVEAYGKVDILFNNASHGFSSPLTMTTLLDTPEKDWNEVIRNNLNSLFFCTKYCQPEMVKAGGGSIINTASSNALVAVPGADAYTAAKGGVVALTRIMAITYAPDIRVNCICPGTVRTPMIADMLAMLEDYLKQNIPLQRVAEPEEIARVALFLASGEASYITGAIIPVDGGWTTM